MGEGEPNFWNQVASSGELISSEKRPLTEGEQLILHKYSDAEISQLSDEVKVNAKANTCFSYPGSFQLFPDLNGVVEPDEVFQQLVQKSGAERVIDLGSATSMMGASEKDIDLLKKAGIKEYVGIDLGLEKDVDWFDHPKDNKLGEGTEKLRCKYIRAEFLRAIHSLPDNYANAWMTGVESYEVIQNYSEWGLALLSELKRVVPKNGFLYTDEGFIKFVLAKLPEYAAFDSSLKQQDKSLREKWLAQNNDPLIPAGFAYVVDMPTVGFRVYRAKEVSSSMGADILLVNTDKKD